MKTLVASILFFAAPAHAEVGVTLGSSTSVGAVGDGVAAGELIGTAANLEVKVGRRITPNLGLSFYAAAQGLAEGTTPQRSVYSGTAGLVADFHLRPDAPVDPWIGIGGGLSALLVSSGHDDAVNLSVGVELARIQIGTDFRISNDFTLGPVIGASASLYGAQRTPMRGFEELDDKGINWTFSAGVAGRFTRIRK